MTQLTPRPTPILIAICLAWIGWLCTTQAGHAQNTIEALNVRLLGQIGGQTNAVVVDSQNKRAYIGEGPRLTILDISDPLTPTVLGRSPVLPDLVYGVSLQGSIAYVAAGRSGLRLIDVSVPATPLEIGFFDTADSARGVDVVGGTAYVADGSSGLRLINITTPTAPSELGFFSPTGYASNVVVSGTVAYVAGTSLALINITNPVAPTLLKDLTTVAASDVAVRGGLAFVVSDGKLTVVNVANPSNPIVVGGYNNLNNANGVAVKGNLVYVAESENGLTILNASNVLSPTVVGNFDTPGYSEDVVVVDTLAYVADGERGLRLLNVTNPTAPNEMAAYDLLGEARAVSIVGNYAYVANGSGGLRVIDLSTPTAARVVGTVYTPGDAIEIAVAYPIALLAAREGGLQMVNISNPTQPQLVGSFATSNSALDVAVPPFGAQYAYVATSVGLQVVDFANPASAIQRGIFTATSIVQGLDMDYGRVYLAVSDAGMQVLQTSSNGPVGLQGTYDTPNYAGGVAAIGRTAYIADGSHVRFVELSDLLEFTPLGSVPVPGFIADLAVVPRTLYAADVYNGLRLINTANLAQPSEYGYFKAPGFPGDVEIANGTVYLAQRWGGLYILRPCYKLTPQHTGSGNDPVLTPQKSAQCSSAGEFLLGESVSLSATPANDWHVASWTGTNNNASTSPANVLTMPASDHVASVIYAPTCYNLTLSHSGEGGNPTPTPTNSEGCNSGQYVSGALITLQATPASGYGVGSWSGTSNNASIAISNTLTMPAATHNVSINYVLSCYGLALTHSGSGGDPLASPTQSAGCQNGFYHFNQTVTFTASPAQGWLVAGWSGTVNNASTAPTNTLMMPPNAHSVGVSYSEQPTAGPGDPYEIDDSCTRASPTSTDGNEVQEHSFHVAADTDWVRFTATANLTYRIEVHVPATSTADVNLELYGQCNGNSLGEWHESFSPEARLDFVATSSGPHYIRLSNQQANQAGAGVRYQVSVRSLDNETSNRALIIVAGRLRQGDRLQSNIHHVTSNVYRLFQHNGYNDGQIRVLATDNSLPGNPLPATKENLRLAITSWAKGNLQQGGVLTLYMMDHGSPELFYIDDLTGQRLSPDELHTWLSELEAAIPNLKINVFIEACQSGSFISQPNSISKVGRLIVTSTDATNDAKASKDGAYFSDHLLTWMQQGYNIFVGWSEASQVAQQVFSLQQAQIDANGNGVANELEDGSLAARRSFAYAGTLPGDDFAPHIFAAQPPNSINNFSGVIEADVRDNVGVRQVWAVVYPPGYSAPPAGQQLQAEEQPTFLLSATGTGTQFAGTFTGFNQAGRYRIIVHAEDEVGLQARPLVIEVEAGSRLFLPAIYR